MTIRVPCPHCGKTIRAPEKAAGRDIRCPGCRGDLIIPATFAASATNSPRGDVDFEIPGSFDAPAPAQQPVPDERIRISCSSCGKSLTSPSRLIGKSVKCPNCQNPIAVERRSAGSSTRAQGSQAASPDDLFNIFDEPSRQGDDSFSADPNDPFAYLDQIPLESSGVDLPAAMPPVVQGVKRKKRRKTVEEDEAAAEPHVDPIGEWTRIFLYAYMGIAMIPLAVTLFLPDSVLGGQHLPEDSTFHWVYASLSAAGFLTLLLVSIRSPDAGPIMLILVGLFTGTVGIVLLLVLQVVAAFAASLHIHCRGIVVLFMLIVKFIGLMYYYALSQDSSFWASFYGFTLGVGLCEELCKLIPVIWYLQNNHGATWKGACLVGLASGIGFGVSEGVMYSHSFYNGDASWEIYVVRFVSCVALHAAWTAAIACTMYRRSDLGGGEFGELMTAIAIWIGLPVLLHGLYDTLLTHQYHGLALLTAGATIGWMSWSVERAARAAP